MKPIENGSFLTLHYRLAGADGSDVINTFGNQPATLSVGAGQLTPAIERRLMGLRRGARQTFALDTDEAFGPRNPQLLQRVKRSLLDQLASPEAQYAVGDVVQFPRPDGVAGYAGLVREVGDDWLLFDFNHPLAGQRVTFEVEVIEVL